MLYLVHASASNPMLSWLPLTHRAPQPVDRPRPLLSLRHVHVQDPDDIITDLQKEVFEGQGIAGEWGITCLGLVGDTYQDDPDFMKLFVAMVER